MLEMAQDAQDGDDYVRCHFQRPRGVVFVYLCTGKPRAVRAEMLGALTLRAQAKYGCRAAVGVATEPLGTGRSYDGCCRTTPLSEDAVKSWRATPDPFGDDSQQLAV
jgi:hypothetical protein